MDHGFIPGVIRGFIDEFEKCPDWVPAMDTGQRSAGITLRTTGVNGFDHWANWLAKVRNVSRLGSQIAFSMMSAI